MSPLTPPEPSESLLRFTGQFPHERRSILAFAQRVAAELLPDSRLLDVGAGNSPYRELFGHLRYETSDWEHSVHAGGHSTDHVGPAHDLPVPDGSFDAILCTQVLEHLHNPGEVLQEFQRILAVGGRLYMTVPFTWELHELPFDYYRYSAHGLHSLLREAGFSSIDIRARNDSFETLAQLLDNTAMTVGRYPDGADPRRAEATRVLRKLAEVVAGYSGLDARGVFPLGFSVAATNRASVSRPRPSVADRARAGLDTARRFVIVCFAAEFMAEPRLLVEYADHFGPSDDATLVIYAPNAHVPIAEWEIPRIISDLGLDGPNAPHVIPLVSATRVDESALAAAADLLLAFVPPSAAFTDVPWAHSGTLAEIKRRAVEGGLL